MRLLNLKASVVVLLGIVHTLVYMVHQLHGVLYLISHVIIIVDRAAILDQILGFMRATFLLAFCWLAMRSDLDVLVMH